MPHDQRSPLARTGGCLLTGILLYLEAAVGIGIAVTVGESLGPALAARGYNPNVGTGYLIGLGLGAMVAVYPIVWLDRLRRRFRGR